MINWTEGNRTHANRKREESADEQLRDSRWVWDKVDDGLLGRDVYVQPSGHWERRVR